MLLCLECLLLVPTKFYATQVHRGLEIKATKGQKKDTTLLEPLWSLCF